MDMFKLLSRSTNLQKSVPSSRTAPQVPSAGDLGLGKTDVLESNENTSIKHDESRPRVSKRKRSSSGNVQGDEIPKQLDFFRPGDGVAGQRTSSAKQTGAIEIAKQAAVTGTQVLADTGAVLQKEECKQILKKHRLKVMLLENGQASQATFKEKRTRAGEKVSRSKNTTHLQLSSQPLTSFRYLRSKYGISKRLAENLDAQGYREPTDVQLGSLPILLGSDEDRGLLVKGAKKSKKQLSSNIDLLTIAPTGSGKTLAFMVPVLHGLLEDRRAQKKANTGNSQEHQVRAIILAPTHELVDQIVNEGRKLAVGTGVRISGMRKGMMLHSGRLDGSGDTKGTADEALYDKDHLLKSNTLVKADILVSTPLMLLHALSLPSLAKPAPLPAVRSLVLDEADVLLDPLFREQTLGIWNACTNASLCTSLWSATIGSSIESLAQSFILDRRRNLGLDATSKSHPHHIIRLVVGLRDSAIPNISHRLIYAASEQGKLLALRQLLHPAAAPSRNAPSLQPPFLVFTQTIPRAIALHSELLYDIPPEAGGSSRIAVLHSDLSDTVRANIMAGFRKGEVWILITTDLLSRGVDFRGMNGVVNYDIPNTGASYVHRAGRTGRQGREGGVAVTLYTKEDIPYVKNVANVIAASERAKGKSTTGGEGQGGLQKWLLDALPDVSKKTKQELKRKGVAGRRAAAEGQSGWEARKMRISTKSGYERRLQNNRKGAVSGSQRRMDEVAAADNEPEDEEWGGIEG